MVRIALRRPARAAVPPGRAAARRRPSPARPAPQPEAPSLDSLAAQWWAALEAGRSALRAAGPTLGRSEGAERAHRLDRERAETIGLLQGLAHDLHARTRLVPWLSAPSVTPRMLGLPSEVTACIFDLDGVLTTSAEVHAAAWSETFDRFLLEQADRHHRPYIPFDRVHDYAEHLAGRPRRDGVHAFLVSRGLGLPEGARDDPPGAETVYGLANRKNQLLRQHLDRQGVHAFEGSRCYLEAARMAGVRRAVVSPSANTATILERAGLATLVETRVDGETMESEHLRPKPAPDTLEAACRRLGVEPGQAVAFETTTAGIAAARAAGMALTIGVDRGGDPDVLRASDAGLVVNDLSELLVEVAA